MELILMHDLEGKNTSNGAPGTVLNHDTLRCKQKSLFLDLAISN